ncbi:MAG: glycosyltransferase family 1 protein [Gallionellaceae bacterium]|nr:glycosyltransferase family 1 protein [Gallionellaceae bacterium]
MIKHDDKLIEPNIAQTSNLRVAIVTETFPPEVNGVAMTLGRIVNGLVQRGYTVQLVRPRQASDNGVSTLEGVEEVLTKGIQIPTYQDLRLGLPKQRRLIKLWTKNRPDIVHVATEGPLGWSAVAAARKLKLPVTSSFHTNFHSYSQHYGIGLLQTIIDNYLRKLHNLTDATMVPTKAMLQELQGRGYQNVTKLSRGVSTELFSPEKRSQALRETWGASPDDVVVLLVGRLAKEKNINLVLTSFQAIKLQLPSAKIVFVGDGPLRDQLEKSCPDAIFAGIRKNEELATHYASGDLFLFSSLTETFGNVVPEALASGLAVVSYDNAAAKELITTGQNGVLVTAGDELEFVNASVDLATNMQKQLAVRQAAAPSVAHLCWDAVHNSFAEILIRALDNHQRKLSPANDNPSSFVVNHASA